MAESILHFGAVTLRVNGSGNLDLKMSSLDNVNEVEMLPLAMSANSAIEPTRRVNFKSQRGALTISVDEFDEWFVINRVIYWVKPVATSYPM